MGVKSADHRVGVMKTIDHYGIEVPFHPASSYPEFAATRNNAVGRTNPIYDAVRNLFVALGMDKDRFGTVDWNPFAGLIVPGNKVFIKPNLVSETNGLGRDVMSLITHASVLRPIVDYAYLALGGRGEIVIGDAPTAEADFHLVTERNRLQPTFGYLSRLYRSGTFSLKLMDLRYARGIEEEFPEYDPLGVEIDLKGSSFLDEFTDREMGNLTYLYDDNSFMGKVHGRGMHKYRIARELLESDVVIHVPKMKTHLKAGVTLCLKNLVGAVTNKAYVPHLRHGTPGRGGDTRADLGLGRRIFRRLGQTLHDGTRSFLYLGSGFAGDKTGFTRGIEARYRWIRPPRGCWDGNDTIWRVALDLNRIALFADGAGVLESAPRRKIFCVIDGIVGGEKNGPLNCLEKPAGVLCGGSNPYAVDLAATRLMGFDHSRIPLMSNAGRQDWLYDGRPVRVVSNVPEWNSGDLVRDYDTGIPDLGFLPPDSWPIELERPGSEARRKSPRPGAPRRFGL